jgi:hypothetical protein
VAASRCTASSAISCPNSSTVSMGRTIHLFSGGCNGNWRSPRCSYRRYSPKCDAVAPPGRSIHERLCFRRMWSKIYPSQGVPTSHLALGDL